MWRSSQQLQPEPDKVLFAKATEDVKHGRYTVGRLALQTLINTYPDSEYSGSKLKLAIADSYYKDGGTSGLKQSIVEYKDFITFFPFLDEAPYARSCRLECSAHYRQMEKPDPRIHDHEAVQTEGRIADVPGKISQQPSGARRRNSTFVKLRRYSRRATSVSRISFIIFVAAYKGGRRAAAGVDDSGTPLYSQADHGYQLDRSGQMLRKKPNDNDIAARYYGLQTL